MATSISAVNAGQRNTVLQAQPNQETLNYDAFLQLLIAQLKNQDPTQPMDASEQVAQLATFSQVEQAVHSNERLAELLSSSLIGQAGSLVGRHVASADGSVAGVVVSAMIYQDGVVAVLDGGQEIVVGPGVVVSERPNE